MKTSKVLKWYKKKKAKGYSDEKIIKLFEKKYIKNYE